MLQPKVNKFLDSRLDMKIRLVTLKIIFDIKSYLFSYTIKCFLSQMWMLFAETPTRITNFSSNCLDFRIQTSGKKTIYPELLSIGGNKQCKTQNINRTSLISQYSNILRYSIPIVKKIKASNNQSFLFLITKSERKTPNIVLKTSYTSTLLSKHSRHY